MPGEIQIDLGDAACLVPREAIAEHRAAFMARQTTGSGPSWGNEEYQAVYDNEVEFGLSKDALLVEWATQHMPRAELERYRVDDPGG